jgi:hypothetical protein
MPIGDQKFVGGEVSAAELKRRYDDLIKEALLKAHPNLEIVRADEVALPGTITSDILTRIMHSDYVLADVTYPNPNVFYELGLRHACRIGTIIVRDKAGPQVPFDIAHLRHIEYENDPSGLKALSDRLRNYFEHVSRNPGHPDNQLQELAKLTNYPFPDYSAPEETDPGQQALMAMLRSPDLLQLLIRQSSGEQVDQTQIFQAMISSPEIAEPLVKAMMRSGHFPQLNSPAAKPTTPIVGKPKPPRGRKRKRR